MAYKTIREKREMRLAGMKPVRQPYEADWEEIARLALPARAQHLRSGTAGNGTRITRRGNQASRDSAGVRASRILSNGMQAGLSSSASPWFKLMLQDRDLMEFQAVKEWLQIVERSIYDLFSSTNFYDATKSGYSELGNFATSACFMVEHSQYKAVCHALSVGEYWIDTDDGLRVDTLYRKVDMTVGQIFGSTLLDPNMVSRQARDQYDKSNYNVVVPVMHAVEPNRDREPGKIDKRNMDYSSVYWEIGQTDKNKLLHEGGYEGKPFWCPRWETTSGETYSEASPGWVALPDLRETQLSARRRGRTKDLLAKPPMKAPTGMAGSLLSLDPGSITYASIGDLEGLGPLLTTQYQAVQAQRDDHMELRRDVDSCYFVDLFMAISQREGVQPLNDLETSLREAEKFTQLGPVVDRVNVEQLEVAIDRAFNMLTKMGVIPPPPPECEGKAMTVQFVSMLARAQRASENTAIERAARFVGFLAGIFPDAAIKFDAEQAIDEFATGTGTPPKIIRTDDIVADMKQKMQAQQDQQQMAAMAEPARDGAQAAELLSRTDVGGGRNMLQALTGGANPVVAG